ncbi:rhomboid family intramembrane serine protease [Halobacillus yeomjeoni]|uniref:Rhomboid family intramembrane serine protease n=1 Tax=Halobacillus yeomjeoni TaxID=311194 RepID=A0A931MV12_9BACI|nr:rhomboid family intramembrane serine protease [Halobacillus yeomjeoni]MBH0229874.1 rhomboid family intramembrane serine protease [Halobacillus yeomjeoni]
MFIDQEYFFWKLTHDLIVNQKFHILYSHMEEREVWLEKDFKGTTHVVRLKHKEMNWRNELKRDLELVDHQLKQNRKLFRGGKVQTHALYISEYPPVDEWEDLLGSRTDGMKVYFMHDENKDSERSRFYKKFNIEDPIVDQDIAENEMEAIIPYLKQQIVTMHQKRKKEAESLFRFGKPFMTIFLLIVNILFFLYVEWQGDTTSVETLIEYGAKYNPEILSGEWWRIVTSMFLHIGVVHLLMNMLALFYLGMAVERIYGTLRFTVIYFMAGVFGGVASFMLNPQVAAGASGAIFGLFGALLFFGIQHKRLFFRTMGWNLIIVIGINIAFGIVVPQVDNGAHLGGLLGGFIATSITHLPKRKNVKLQALATVSYVLLISSMVFFGVQNVFNGGNFTKVQQTQELNKQGEYDKVIQITTEALEDPGRFEAELLFNRSFAYIREGDEEEALKDLEKVTEISPDLAEAHYNLAILYQQKGNTKKAAAHANTAADLKPDNEDFQRLKDELDQ